MLKGVEIVRYSAEFSILKDEQSITASKDMSLRQSLPEVEQRLLQMII